MYAYVFICMHTYLYVYVYVASNRWPPSSPQCFTCMYTRIYMCNLYVCIRIYMYKYVYGKREVIDRWPRTRIHTRIHICIRVRGQRSMTSLFPLCFIYMYTRIYMCISMCMHMYSYVYIYVASDRRSPFPSCVSPVCIHLFISEYPYVCIRMYVYMCTWPAIHDCTFPSYVSRVCIYISICIYPNVCMYMYMYKWLCIYMYIYTHTWPAIHHCNFPVMFHLYVYTYSHVKIYMCAHTCMCIHTAIGGHHFPNYMSPVCVQILVYVHLNACIYMYMYT